MGYVGLPLAIEFAKKFYVLGFDISKSRIFELKKVIDSNGEFKKNEILKNKFREKLSYNNLKSKFELKQQENNLKSNLVQEITQDILIYLNSIK